MSTTATKALRKGIEKHRGVAEGTVVKFDRHFNEADAIQRRIPQTITYAAIFVAGKWFYTGRGSLGQSTSTHPEFLEMLASPNISNVQVATQYEEV